MATMDMAVAVITLMAMVAMAMVALAMAMMAMAMMAMAMHRRSSLYRFQSRASVSFCHPLLFAKGIASRRLPSVQAELIWAAVHDHSESDHPAALGSALGGPLLRAENCNNSYSLEG